MGDEILEEPLLDVNVANYVERGLLGIATAGTNPPRNDKDNGQTANVFLYFTEPTKRGPVLSYEKQG